MKNLIILDSERRNLPTSNKVLLRIYNFLESCYLKIIYTFFILPKLKKYVKQETKIIAVDEETEAILKEKKIPFCRIADYINEYDYKKYKKKKVYFF